MSWFRSRRSRQTPPISLILLLVGFILVAFVFIGFRQLRGAQERRLRLLAGFSERVESTVEDLTDRFVRIVGVEEEENPDDDESTGEETDAEDTDGDQATQGEQPPRNVQYVTQRKEPEVIRYLDHVPYISHLHLSPDCPKLEQDDEEDETTDEGFGEPTAGTDEAVQRAERAAKNADEAATRAAAAAERAEQATTKVEGSVDLWASGPYARLKYCPPKSAVLVSGQEGNEYAESPADVGQETPPSDSNASDEETERQPRGYLARIDLEGLIEPMILPGVFESILLANHQGEVLFQQGEPALRMLDLGPLLESSAEREDEDNALTSLQALLERQGSVDPEIIRRTFEAHESRPLELGARTAMVEVKVAGSDYFVFLQPVSPRLEPPPGHGAGKPVRWIAAGVISSEHLLSSGLTTSPFLLFILVSILPLGIITWPFLKLALITRRQRFNRLDLASLLFATVVGISLAALLVFDLLFLARIHQNVDHQLGDLGDAIADRFRKEVLDARDQLVELDDWVSGKETSEDLLPRSTDNCRARGTGQGSRSAVTGPGIGDDGSSPQDECPSEVSDLGDLHPIPILIEPDGRPGGAAGSLERSESFIEVCMDHFLGEHGNDLIRYPYFDSVFWATREGDHACANLPLRRHAVLPQNVKDRKYFLCARDCDPEPVFLPSGPPPRLPVDSARWSECRAHVFELKKEDTIPICLQSFLDRTTGKSVAAVALPRSLEEPHEEPSGDPSKEPPKELPVAALVARLTSVGHPVLPRHFGFAIVEPSGQVLFHSDPRRDLTENFLEASDEDPVLRSMIENGRRGPLGLNYWGQPTRVHVRPLEGLDWSLITYRNTYDLRVRNFELIYDFLNPFLLYLGALLLVAIVAWLASPRWLRPYLWPSATLRHWYRAICIATLLVTGVFALVLHSGHPESIFFASFLALPAIAALTLLVLWVSGGHTAPKSREPIDRPGGTPIGRKDVGNPQEGASIGERLRWSARSLAAKVKEGRKYLKRAWQRKSWWLPGSFLLLLGILVCTALASGGPAMPVLLGGTALGLFAALAWRWYDFEGERRQVAFVFAAGCTLLVVALLPALAFFSLSRSRQTQLYTQETQVRLARRLEDRRGEIEARQGPIASIYGEDRPYSNELNVTRDAYLEAFFGTTLGKPVGDQDPFWLYGLPGEHGEETTSEDGLPGVVQGLLSARPFPLNDLSARPVESDLSRFESAGLDWTRKGPRNLVLAATTHRGAGQEFHLASTIPDTTTLDRVPFLKGVTVVLGLLLLAASPFLLAFFIADRVLLISLVGQPSRKVPSRESLRKSAARMAGKPLAMILDEVRRTREVVRQVVLVSTLPGRSAWKYQVEESSDPSSARDTSKFHKVSFTAAWRQSESPPDVTPGSGNSDPEGKGNRPTGEDEGKGTGDGPTALEEAGENTPLTTDASHSEDDRVKRLCQALLPDGAVDDPVPTPARPGSSQQQVQPILITDFEPELADARSARVQTAALRHVSSRRSVVIVTETIPDPAVLADEEEDDREATEARRQWTALLGRFSVEYGFDARTYDLARKVSRIESDQLERLQRKQLSPALREDLWNIRSNARWVVRECSPTPVLRNVGWALLQEIRDVLQDLLEDLEEAERQARDEEVEDIIRRIATGDTNEVKKEAVEKLAELVRTTEAEPDAQREDWAKRIRKAGRGIAGNGRHGDQAGTPEDTGIESTVRRAATPADDETRREAIEELAELLEALETQSDEGKSEQRLLADRIRRAARSIGSEGDPGESEGAIEQALRRATEGWEAKGASEELRAALKAQLEAAPEAERAQETERIERSIRQAARRVVGRRREEESSEVLERVIELMGADTVDDTISLLSRAASSLRNEEILRRRIERNRRLLQLFTCDHVIAKVGTEARLHYRYLWSLCTTDEKLLLVQLAEDGLVNPKYYGWLMDLMNRGLVVRDPDLRVMNKSFGRFVRQEVRRSQILEWEEEEGPSAWNVLKWILPAPLILVAVFLFATQRDALSNVTGVIVAAVSLAPILINLYGQFRQVNVRREAREEEKDEKKKDKG